MKFYVGFHSFCFQGLWSDHQSDSRWDTWEGLQCRPGSWTGDSVLSVLSEVTVFVLKVVLGLHIVRGDNICVVGEIDEDIDSRLDLHNLKAEPINAVPHGI